MIKVIKQFLYMAGFLAVIFTAGCTDKIAPEITELDFDRLLSPTELDVRVINKTSARLNWKSVKNATSYTIEFFTNGDLDFTGNPFMVVSEVVMDQLPIIIPGFPGETSISVRVKAIGPGIDDSKWVSSVFNTEAEQIMYDVNPEEIEPNSVILRWPAGESATEIVLNPGNITHTLTPDEIAAGVAEVTGLTGETHYTANLINGSFARGQAAFETLFDLTQGTVVSPTDNLKTLIEASIPGQVFVLLPGTYTITDNILISNTIRILGARPTNKPVIENAVLRLRAGAGLNLKNLELTGALAPDGNQAIIYDELLAAGLTYGDLLIENSVIRDYVKGVLYGSIAVLVESVTIRGTIYANNECNGGDFIDFRSGMTKKFDFYNNTVYNSAWNRDFFRMDNATAFSGTNTSIITIENNTFYNIINTAGTTRRILYIRLASHQITVNKNIFAEVLGNYSNQSSTTVVGMSNNNYHNAPNLTTTSFTVHDAGVYTTLNPGFVDPGNGNFKVTNQELIFNGIGDPRWLK
jgi:hypothetical protein